MKVILPSGMTRLTVVLLCLLIAVVAVYSMFSRAGASAHSDPARIAQNMPPRHRARIAGPDRSTVRRGERGRGD